MPELLQDSLPFVRCSACDCMSLIGEQTFVELPVSERFAVPFQMRSPRWLGTEMMAIREGCRLPDSDTS